MTRASGAASPDESAAAYNNLGVSLIGKGRLAEATACFQRAVQLDATHAAAHSNLGAALRRQGKLDEAIQHLRQALHLKPDLAEVHSNLGNALREQGKLGEAVASFHHALRLKPNYPEGLYNLGQALLDQGTLEQAITCFQRALQLRPQYLDVLISLGNVLRQQGRLEDALATFERALRLKPDTASPHPQPLSPRGQGEKLGPTSPVSLTSPVLAPSEAQNAEGIRLVEQGKFEKAIAHFRQAVRLKPDNVEAHNNLGAALKRQGKLEEAVECYREALRLKPDCAEAFSNLGNALRLQGRLDEAVASFHQALRLKPGSAETHNNLSNTLKDQGKLEEALAGYQRAVELKPDYAEAHLDRAITWLLLGDLEHGWTEYEWRWQHRDFPPRPFAQPRWDGSPLEGRTILLHAEQGLGDTLHFIRYAPLVQERGGRVLVECQRPLLRLLSRCPGVETLIAQGAALPDFEVHSPLMSLPFLFRTTVATIPAAIPYVLADPTLVEQWRRELAPLTEFKVGIAWQGNPKHTWDHRRSIPLGQFAPLAWLPGVRLFSLQKGPGSEQIQGAAFPITDLACRLDDKTGPFMDTAAVLKNLDLVITADTSLAHLAGALGVPVWIALFFTPDWRWLLDRDDSPWYPTVRLFRQQSRGDWKGVFERMVAALRQRLASRSTPLVVPVTPGELLERIALLEIQAEAGSETAELQRELSTLRAERNRGIIMSEILTSLAAELKAAHRKLRQTEEELRRCEDQEDFGTRFVDLARALRRWQEACGSLRRRINDG